MGVNGAGFNPVNQAAQYNQAKFGQTKPQQGGVKFGFVEPISCCTLACCGPVLIPVAAGAGFFGIRKLIRGIKSLFGKATSKVGGKKD